MDTGLVARRQSRAHGGPWLLKIPLRLYYYDPAAFCFAHRFFCAKDILALAAALIFRRLGGADSAALLFLFVPPRQPRSGKCLVIASISACSSLMRASAPRLARSII